MSHVEDILPLSFQSTNFPSVVLPGWTCCQIAHNEERSPRLLPISHMRASKRTLPHVSMTLKTGSLFSLFTTSHSKWREKVAWKCESRHYLVLEEMWCGPCSGYLRYPFFRESYMPHVRTDFLVSLFSFRAECRVVSRLDSHCLTKNRLSFVFGEAGQAASGSHLVWVDLLPLLFSYKRSGKLVLASAERLTSCLEYYGKSYARNFRYHSEKDVKSYARGT